MMDQVIVMEQKRLRGLEEVQEVITMMDHRIRLQKKSENYIREGQIVKSGSQGLVKLILKSENTQE